MMQNNDFMSDNSTSIGIWDSKYGYMHLLPNEWYRVAEDKSASTYTGRYPICGSLIDYVDNSGFAANREFYGGIFYHEEMIFYLEGQE